MEGERAHKAVRVWMRDVMKTKGWTAAEWARRAGTSPTNITRVLSPTATIIPKSSTISLLAAVAGSQPQLMGLAHVQPTAITVPLLTPGEVAAIGGTRLWDRIMGNVGAWPSVQVDRPLEGPTFAFEVEGDGLEGRGLVAGDRVLIQKHIGPLMIGAIVLVEHEGEPRLAEWGDRSVFFRPPMSRVMDPKYNPIPIRDVHVIGRAISLIRDL